MTQLGEMLLGEGILTAEQVDRALEVQAAEGGFLGSILCRMHFLTEDDLVACLARQTGASTIDLEKTTLGPELVAIVDESLARQHHCVPVGKTGNVLHVAMAEPYDTQAQEAIGFRTGLTIKALVASPVAIEQAWARLYGRNETDARRDDRAAKTRALEVDQYLEGALDSVSDHEAKETRDEVFDLDLTGQAAPVIRLVNGVLVKGIEMRASDIHIEPMDKEIRVRLRIDGVLHPVLTLPAAVKTTLVARIKIMAGLDISEHRFPQDGRVKVKAAEGPVDLRISTLPSQYGEKIVIRVLGQGAVRDDPADLGFHATALEHVRNALSTPYGMILVTGPTGSGKTTTLYTFLRHLSSDRVNVVTAEDPVEYNLEGITQVSVRPTIGYTFDLALRAFLRQDPDVIMVGEMRDYETAAVAVKAALTGHLVLSTLHTNDAPSTVVRLIDMGIEPYLVASAVQLVLAQRLVRRICSWCKAEVDLSGDERVHLEESELDAIQSTFRGAGCVDCNETGYRGRVPVYEVMPVRSKEMKRIVTEASTEIQVAQVARREGIHSLKDEALRLVNDGQTTVEEALSILMAD